MTLRLSVIGTGYLGATHAACMADLGYDVIGVDIDPSKVAVLQSGSVPFYEPGLDEVLRQAVFFTKALNESDGTLGKLVRDPRVYEDLAAAAANVKNLSRDLRPIVDDIRVFSDKIARHPEQLGVRGALDRRPGIK